MRSEEEGDVGDLSWEERSDVADVDDEEVRAEDWRVFRRVEGSSFLTFMRIERRGESSDEDENLRFEDF